MKSLEIRSSGCRQIGCLHGRSPDHRITRSPDFKLVVALLFVFAMPGWQAAAQSPQDVPVIDAGLGPCSVELTVTDGQAKGVYAATVKVHITYGFAGVRKMDLEAGTNSAGKVSFKGLPAKVHNPPLEFHATKDDLTGLASYNPASECQGKHDIILEKVKPPATQ